MNVVVPPSYIEFGEVRELAEVIYKVRDKGEGVSILDGVFFQVSVILYGAEFSILLLDKEKGRGLRGF